MTVSGRVERYRINVYGRAYPVRVLRRISAPPASPRLVVVAYQPNKTAKEILRLCLEAIRRYTPEEHELWVVDNASPKENARWLEKEPGVNVVLNRSRPLPRFSFLRKLFGRGEAQYAGSYANAVALEIAARLIDPDSRLMMTLHMDTMPCRTGWLSYLVGRLDDRVRCVGVRLDTMRVRTVHVLGMLFDFSLFRSLGLTFAHDMPHHDTGDGISLSLERSGYGIWACPNSLWEPELVDSLPVDSPFRGIKVDRSFDDNGQVIFLHLGRGVLKSQGDSPADKTSPDKWLRFGRETVLCDRHYQP